MCRSNTQPSVSPLRIHRFLLTTGPIGGFLLSSRSSRTRHVNPSLRVRPFSGVCFRPILWPLLTSAGSAEFHNSGYRALRRSRQTSPGKNAIFPPIYLPHLLSTAFGSKDFALYGKLIQLSPASYAVSVRQAGGLPPASFRFHLTMDTLAVRLTVPPAGSVGDLHPQVSAPCRAHEGRKARR